MNKTVYIGADHAGFYTKQSIVQWLENNNYTVEDLGAHTLDPNDDYPQYASLVAKSVASNHGSLGILSCGNAQGVCIVANKFDSVRAGVGFSVESAKTMRQDDNANIICIPGRIETCDDPIEIIKAFLTSSFTGEKRHIRRLSQITGFEQNTNIVIPTILVNNPETFASRITNSKVRALAPIWQIDVLDESMFESTSWFDPIEIGKIENLPEIELHLMILDPMPIIELSKFHLKTLKRVIIHAEIDKPLEPIIAYAKNLGLEVGVALNPETKLKTIKTISDKLNSILIMGVRPGASNQPFLGRKILRKIKKAKKTYPYLNIEVDGGINKTNAHKIIKAGADKLCVGSAIWQADDPQLAIELLSPTGL